MARGAKQSVGRIKPPRGTRDMYPEDALKRRYLEQAWRDASVRCGFEEIHGPIFETTDLYAVKSGEGILGELFQAYSGKSPEEVAQVQETGRAPFAMRPEFTPTLARMFAARAGALPRPCKWFTGGSYFRAERPQRGRLREFLQWNVDVIGLPGDLGADDDGAAVAKAQMDIECVECGCRLLELLGLSQSDMAVELYHREAIESELRLNQVPENFWGATMGVLDAAPKLESPTVHSRLADIGLSGSALEAAHFMATWVNYEQGTINDRVSNFVTARDRAQEEFMAPLIRRLDESGLGAWCQVNPRVVRGLAYYTGTVFEVLADGERAVAGGGRYDNLIELMGGPPTPAVGFAMGDVVVSLLLEDKGLMPEGSELMEAVSRRPASVRPEVFVAGADDESSDALVRRLNADLRRGIESDSYKDTGDAKPWSAARYETESGGVRPMHARVSYKSTRNLKKLLGDGEKQFARLAAIVHGDDRVQLKDFDTRKDLTPADVGLSDAHAEFSVDPASPVYVGRAAERILG